MKEILRFILRCLHPWIAELVIRRILPGKIGRYIVLDTLIAFVEGQDVHPK
jgi:hypothetical protein